MSLFRGISTAIITPFDKKGVDLVALKKQIKFQLSSGVNAIVVLGTTGESNTLTHAERVLVITKTLEFVNNKIPVIVGTGSLDTVTAIKHSIQAEDLGADGVLVVTPYYNKCTQQGLISHYKAISKKINIPIILYSVPSRTGVNIDPRTLAVLSRLDNIVGLKDASGNLVQMQEYLLHIERGFDIYSGDDALLVPYMSQNASGLISVMSNIIPQELVTIYDYCKQQDYVSAMIKSQQIKNLQKAVFSEVNPIGIKAAMQLANMDSGKLRLPLTKMSRTKMEKIKKAIQNL